MRLRSRKSETEASNVMEDLPHWRINLADIAQKEKLRAYRDGLSEGMILSLEMILGENPSGGKPYDGPVPPELEEYVRRALRNAKAAA